MTPVPFALVVFVALFALTQIVAVVFDLTDGDRPPSPTDNEIPSGIA